MKIVYFSASGNTLAMANYIKEGIEMVGHEVQLIEVDSAKVEDVIKEDIIILGCPAYGEEELEGDFMEPFVDSMKDKLQGKKVALFGSYGWGNGEWMKEWEKKIRSFGADLITDSLIMYYGPTGIQEDACRSFGMNLGSL